MNLPGDRRVKSHEGLGRSKAKSSKPNGYSVGEAHGAPELGFTVPHVVALPL